MAKWVTKMGYYVRTFQDVLLLLQNTFAALDCFASPWISADPFYASHYTFFI